MLWVPIFSRVTLRREHHGRAVMPHQLCRTAHVPACGDVVVPASPASGVQTPVYSKKDAAPRGSSTSPLSVGGRLQVFTATKRHQNVVLKQESPERRDCSHVARQAKQRDCGTALRARFRRMRDSTTAAGRFTSACRRARAGQRSRFSVRRLCEQGARAARCCWLW